MENVERLPSCSKASEPVGKTCGAATLQTKDKVKGQDLSYGVGMDSLRGMQRADWMR